MSTLKKHHPQIEDAVKRIKFDEAGNLTEIIVGVNYKIVDIGNLDKDNNPTIVVGGVRDEYNLLADLTETDKTDIKRIFDKGKTAVDAKFEEAPLLP